MSPSALTPEVNLLLAKCVGKKIKIPYMFDLCPAWSLELNTYDDEVEVQVEKWRQMFVVPSLLPMSLFHFLFKESIF